MTKYVYMFDEGNKDMASLLGGKGANLAEMTNAGLPVPPGFTVTTEACNAFYDNDRTPPEGLWDEMRGAMDRLAQDTGKAFGGSGAPLLVSVSLAAMIVVVQWQREQCARGILGSARP